MTTTILVALIAFAGSLTQASTGFGFAIVCMALWPLVIPVKAAAVTELVTAIVMTVGLAIKMRHHIQFKKLTVPFLASCVTGTLGVFILVSSYEAIVRRIFGVTLIAICVWQLLGRRKAAANTSKLSPQRQVAYGVVAGSLSGFLGGLFNIGGPPIVGYFKSSADDKMSYSATLQAYFILNSLAILVIHAMMGNVTTGSTQYIPEALAGVLLGTGLGYWIFKKITWKTMDTLIYAFMILFGIYLTIFA